MLESNPPRNNRLQTHQDDEAQGEAGDCFALRPREARVRSRHGKPRRGWPKLRPGCGSAVAVTPTADSAPKSVITSLAGFAGTRYY